MPKEFSENEREHIVIALKKAALESIQRTGMKKTSVDELVRLANIPKGTFYLFFPSKEMLFFAVFLDEHNRIQEELVNGFARYNGKVSKNDFSSLVFSLYRTVRDSFLFTLMTGGEMEVLLRKLPASVVGEHLAQDDFSMEKLFAAIPQSRGKNAKIYSAAFRSIFLLSLHKKEIGEDFFDDAVELLIEGISEKLFQEESGEGSGA